MSQRTRRRLRIVSGGQTGVDRAALAVAMRLDLPCGGWCPLGRRAADGRLDMRWPLQETPLRTYAQRTCWNVLDSDATLILAARPLTGGTRLTEAVATEHDRPCLVCDPATDDAEAAAVWITEGAIRTLNVAGPRERAAEDVQPTAEAWLERLLTRFA